MKMFHFFCVCFFSFLAIINATGQEKSVCLEKEKALDLLEEAKDLLTKVGESISSCKENLNSTDLCECSGEKPLTLIEISKKLISDTKENYPACFKPIEKDDKIVEQNEPRDCSEILASGRNKSGVYTIWRGPNDQGTFVTGKKLQVYCDMETDKGGWTVIQRRGKFPVQQDFFKDWKSYENGFGKLTEEFWLGNANIRILCLNGCEIRFDLQDENGKKGYAHYQHFSLLSSNYHISIKGYTGDVGDDMQYHDGYEFSTKDNGNTERARVFNGGWWYRRTSFFINLNGIYRPGKSSTDAVIWHSWRGTYNLANVEMKVKVK